MKFPYTSAKAHYLGSDRPFLIWIPYVLSHTFVSSCVWIYLFVCVLYYVLVANYDISSISLCIKIHEKNVVSNVLVMLTSGSISRTTCFFNQGRFYLTTATSNRSDVLSMEAVCNEHDAYEWRGLAAHTG